jgi:hypothetical protein
LVYRKNLEEIILEAKRKNIKVVLSTLAHNYMVPPIWESSDPGLENPLKYSLNELEIIVKSGNSNPLQEYYLGVYFYLLKDFELAKKHFDHSYDRSKRTFVAPTVMNDIVLDLAQKYDTLLVDTNKAINLASYGGLAGFSKFVDNCHFNSKGNKILMNELCSVIGKKFISNRSFTVMK